MRAALLALGGLLAAGTAPAQADPGAAAAGATPQPSPAALLVARTSARERVEQLLEDGRHVRFGTGSQGPVHVWWPRSYRAASAVTVVYLHGYFTDVDRAFLEHNLPRQFRDSGKNALFVVPEAPASGKDEPFHPDLGALLALVRAQAKVEPPHGPVTVVAHSGAYRTVARWLGEPTLERVVLVDGLYGADGDLGAWVDGGRGRQLVLVGFETTQRSEWFLRRRAGVVKLDDVPWAYDAPPAGLRGARVAFVDAQRLDHMQLVADGRLVPWLLRALLP